MKPKSLCNVCLKNEAKGVFASRIAPVSLAYCESCLNVGAEDYNIVVSTAVIYQSQDAEFEKEARMKEILKITIEVTGHTLEEFYRDVEIELQKFLGKKKTSVVVSQQVPRFLEGRNGTTGTGSKSL